MSIMSTNENRVFHLQGKDISYIIQVLPDGHLAHVYYGRKIRDIDVNHFVRTIERPWSPSPDYYGSGYALDSAQLEYPCFGHVDFRHPAIHLQYEDGTTITDLRFSSYELYKGKKPIKGLPSTYVLEDDEAQTLEITLKDTRYDVDVNLKYCIYEDRNVMTRSVEVKNNGKSNVKILNVQSLSVDFEHSDFEMLQLSGAWARERHMVRRRLVPGEQSIGSGRGASSHQQNPFIALMSISTKEKKGEVYGFNFVYSGNFQTKVEVSEQNQTRLTMGINPFDFSWLLEPGQSFLAPEVVMVYSHEGLSGMSRTFHDLYRERLIRGYWKNKVRPILVNNWEATYFDFDHESLLNLAKVGSELGIELFVLDDGWFGKRDNDTCSLGDWYVNENKLKGGLRPLTENIEKLNMKFGLWVEPEMISPDSDLYRLHPDWCLQVTGLQATTCRSQLILDYSNPIVCEAIVEVLSKILSKAPISYIKWDMNRNMTDVGSTTLCPERQRETAHRYILGLYDVMEKVTSMFPEILFEGCAGGGGRFDPGILHYMPQIWTSDNTDAVERLKIQYGTSLVYPIISMGCNVSTVPNHQVGRVTPFKSRANVAMAGCFGYQLDLTKLTKNEKETIKKQIIFYKENRETILFGNFYRLLSPFENKDTSWMWVSKDQSEAVVFYMKILAIPNAPLRRIKLEGLDATQDYCLQGHQEVFGGDELMFAGFNLPILNDFESVIYKFNKEGVVIE